MPVKNLFVRTYFQVNKLGGTGGMHSVHSEVAHLYLCPFVLELLMIFILKELLIVS